jgi:hypothetical protein
LAAREEATLNLAEAEMRLGNLTEAVSGYREAQQIAAEIPGSALSAILASWGLAAALDRAGDPAGSAREAKLAASMDTNERIIEKNMEDVFFEPEYERNWYVALGAQVDARAAADPRASLVHWKRAVHFWSAYLADAERADPKGLPQWLPLARAHLEAANRELAVAKKRVSSLPSRPRPLIDIDE